MRKFMSKYEKNILLIFFIGFIFTHQVWGQKNYLERKILQKATQKKAKEEAIFENKQFNLLEKEQQSTFWSKDIVIGGHINRHEKAPFIASSFDGSYIYIVWEDWNIDSQPDMIGIAFTKDYGNSWNLTDLDLEKPLHTPVVTLTNSHAIIVFRQQTSSNNSDILVASLPLGSLDYSDRIYTIDDDSDDDRRPYICSDVVNPNSEDALLGVVYYDATNKKIIFIRSLDQGMNWSGKVEVANIKTEPNAAPFQSIAFSNDRFHITFVANNENIQGNPPHPWYCYSLNFFGGSWSTPQDLCSNILDGNYKFWFPIIDSKDDFVFIAFNEVTYKLIYYSWSNDNGNNWFASGLSALISYGGKYPHISIEPDSGNKIHLGWVNVNDHNFYIASAVYSEFPSYNWTAPYKPNDISSVSDDDRVALVSTYGPSNNLVVASAWAYLLNSYDTYFDAEWIPVPIELSSFEASAVNNDVILYWKTATETNNYGFAVERSQDKINFEKIGFVKGHGTTSIPQSYSYIDRIVQVGTYYYKLKQIDIDGSFEYSEIVEAIINKPQTFELSQNHPNPFNSSTVISFHLPKTTNVKLIVYNIQGEQLEVLTNKVYDPGHHEIIFNANRLPSGLFLYRLEAAGFTAVKKFIVLK